MRVVNISKSTLLGDKIDVARTDYERRLGLIPRNSLKKGEGLIIIPCSAIHMRYMKFPIDVLFVNRNNIIIYILENFEPWQVSKLVDKSEYVIELPVGIVKESNTKIGDEVKIYQK